MDRADLQAIAEKPGTIAGPGDREDINNDGVIDVSDLAIAALHLGEEVPA